VGYPCGAGGEEARGRHSGSEGARCARIARRARARLPPRGRADAPRLPPQAAEAKHKEAQRQAAEKEAAERQAAKARTRSRSHAPRATPALPLTLARHSHSPQDRAAAEKRAEGARLDVKASEHVAEEKRKAEARRAHEAQIKADRDAQLTLAETKRREAAAKKHAEETKLLAHMQAQLDKDKRAMAAKKAEDTLHMLETVKANEAKIAAAAKALVAAKEEDTRIAEEYTRMLNAQDERRQAALRDLFDKTHLRAQVAGESAVKAAAERERDELERITTLQAERAREQDAAAAAKAAKAKASSAEQVSVLNAQMAAREAAKRAAAADLKAHSQNVLRQDNAAEAEDWAKEEARKERDLAHQAFLAAQVADKSAVKAKAHLMTPQEKELNRQRLEQAASAKLK
jgi:hypothetical protein